MITKLHIENFKSLADFDLPPNGLRLGKFTCLVGLNGSGKSTLLQAVDFLAHLVTGDVGAWLAQRDWKNTELATQLGGKRSPIIAFRVALDDADGGNLVWHGRFNTTQLRCTFERVEAAGRALLELNDAKLFVAGEGAIAEPKLEPLKFVFQGSVLSAVALQKAASGIGRVKDTLANLKSLELLSPQLMRRRARKAEDIGAGGEKLSAFLGTFKPEQRRQLLDRLREFYPSLKDWSVKSLVYGWKNLRVTEDYGGSLSVNATHMNDGLLRVMAILAQAQSSHSFLLFDEIENGINPELVEKLVAFLVNLDRQVIVTTHSPMILNYIPDDVAREAVMLLYKQADGRTRCVRFFDLPEASEKLRALGPGEVFVDTKLENVAARLAAASRGP
jgi:predicted ATPase